MTMTPSFTVLAMNRVGLLRYVFPGICGALGTWQVFRWQQKKELLAEIEELQASPPKVVNSATEITSNRQKYQVNGLEGLQQRVLVGPRGNSAIPGGYAFLQFELAKLPNGQAFLESASFHYLDK